LAGSKDALAEGWDIFDVDSRGVLEIERGDEAEIFETDEAAVVHVSAKAAERSELQRRALHEYYEEKS
jgi:hypothetical protein